MSSANSTNDKQYNDICKSWNYQLLLPFFGAGVPSKTFSARTRDELDFILNDKAFNKADVIQVVEVFMDKYDYPWRVTAQVDLAMAANKKRAEEKARKRKVNGE